MERQGGEESGPTYLLCEGGVEQVSSLSVNYSLWFPSAA